MCLSERTPSTKVYKKIAPQAGLRRDSQWDVPPPWGGGLGSQTSGPPCKRITAAPAQGQTGGTCSSSRRQAGFLARRLQHPADLPESVESGNNAEFQKTKILKKQERRGE